MEYFDDVEDRSGVVFKHEFFNELGAAVVPNTINWTLTDGSGAVINSRNNETVTPADTIYITLDGDDTAYADGNERILVVKAPYNSSLTGGPVENNKGSRFKITDLPNTPTGE